MDKLSVVILTKNEEAVIRDCLESVKWAHEIVIVDDYSTDRTVEICREYTDKIFQKKLNGFSEQRGFGINKTSGDWIFHFDADEMAMPPLQEEIKAVLKNGTEYDGFLIPRPTNYLGSEIRYCGWNSKTMVLFRKEKGRYDGKLVHESVIVDGRIGHLKNNIMHRAYKNLSEHFSRMELYTSLDAEDMWRKGVRLNPLNYPVYFFMKPVFVFFRKYIFMGGIMDGVRGFFISVITAFIVFMNYAKLWEMQKNVPHK